MAPELRPSALTVLVVGAVLLSGCSAAIGPLSDDTEREVVEQVSERFNDIDGFSAVQEAHIVYDGTNTTVRAKTWSRPGTGQSRTKILQPADQAGDVTVTGNDSIWMYDQSENTATRMNVSLNTSSQLLSGEQLQHLVDRYDIVYEGTTQLDGVETHKLTLSTNESAIDSALGTAEMTMWVHAEKQFPVKIESVVGDDIRTTVQYENISINPGLSDDRFEFDPPAGATIETPSYESETYDTRSELIDSVETAVSDPDVPDGFDFEQASVMNERSVTQQYSNGTASLTISSVDGETSVGPSDAESITVGDTEGYYRSYGEMSVIRWDCNETSYSVLGDLSKTQLRSVAESIDC